MGSSLPIHHEIAAKAGARVEFRFLRLTEADPGWVVSLLPLLSGEPRAKTADGLASQKIEVRSEDGEFSPGLRVFLRVRAYEGSLRAQDFTIGPGGLGMTFYGQVIVSGPLVGDTGARVVFLRSHRGYTSLRIVLAIMIGVFCAWLAGKLQPRPLGDDEAAFSSGLAPLTDLLAELYPTENGFRRVVDEAGIPPGQIAFQNAAVDNWHEILTEAMRRRLICRLVDVAMDEYPERADELRETYRRFSAKNEDEEPDPSAEEPKLVPGSDAGERRHPPR